MGISILTKRVFPHIFETAHDELFPCDRIALARTAVVNNHALASEEEKVILYQIKVQITHAMDAGKITEITHAIYARKITVHRLKCPSRSHTTEDRADRQAIAGSCAS
ncbi:hypothetical protein EVAR_78863_1 [Eumeta japonica]|uniref:Uncharacterized protein n=1 Tax=Eumeta variegata TaxID=151549 RepID=A0A4C1U3T3_EUMVA|nr:hypothetical protein EVAR_78863_1 [Eumeta japonica]